MDLHKNFRSTRPTDFGGSLIGVDYYKGLFNEVPMTFRHT